MNAREKGLFAGRGITARVIGIAFLVVIAAFALGIAVGWGTGLVADRLSEAGASPSPSPTPSPSATPDVSLPPLEPIERELDEADALAGVVTLDVPMEGEGTYRVVSSDSEPTGDAAAIRLVRIEYEDGLEIRGRQLSQFVLAALNDPRGWGARGRYEFVPTAGAADLRVVFASPASALTLCPNPHEPATTGGVSVEVSPSPSAEPTAADDATVGAAPTVSPTATPAQLNCADQGIVLIDDYDWTAGLPSYGDDRTAARVYLINHGVGHVLGEQDGECASGRALIQTDQRDLPEDCEPNPWPWPDEPVPSPSPSSSPSATPSTTREP